MPYSVSRLIVDDKQNVAAVEWVYSNGNGSITNTHVMDKPFGSTPLRDVTEPLSVEWLVSQLKNTSEELDAVIAQHKSHALYQATLKPYEPHPDAPPTPITMPAPVEPEVSEEKQPEPVAEPEATALPAPEKKSRAKAKK